MSAFSSFCVPEVEGCGPVRSGRGISKHLVAIESVGCLQLSSSSSSSSGEPACLQHIVGSNLSTDVCCIDSSSTLSLLDAQQLRCTYTLAKAHAAPVTCCCFLHSSSSVLLTSSQDGAVKLWDLRQQHRPPPAAAAAAAAAEATVQIAPPGSRAADLWALAVRGDDLVFAAAFKNTIKGFDLRAVCSSPTSDSPSQQQQQQQQQRPKLKQRRSKKLLWELLLHGDTVTALQFHPVQQQLLLSGGEDSLVCVADTAAASSSSSSSSSSEEGGGLVSCFSQERAVKSLSLVGPGASCVCICSAMEDVGLWQLEGLQHYAAAAAAAGAAADAAVAAHRKAEWLSIRSHPQIREGESSGYIINTFYDEDLGRLFILAGSVSGQLLLLHANLDGVEPAAVFRSQNGQGHCGVIRGAVSTAGKGTHGFGLLTCGEDGRVCAWRQRGYESQTSSSSSSRSRHAVQPY
ncbi:WD domain, G-beta repeat-containing protein, putative [Eimeria tenella]|uniref:WD domain, G-beta repeat-containing protein, putative n=1 Tax=Eimeria tenella TaxID=5802 RepID=U6L420_EIMTE|nr:WD domain, G-beta repeat-containing protein, putative [Eimeria tenella]CDJ43374.1 WD domain, G-beta repeat-containing protein, putative [Eimeria tenella]|eukprot:XP_013234124.1 WD domain, G-beta repeat-containing protein, putative [Eimeria tenella]